MSRLTDQQIACIPFAGIRSTMHSNAIAVLACGKYDRCDWLRLDVKLRRNSPQWTYEASRSTSRLMPPTDLRPSWLSPRKQFWSTVYGWNPQDRRVLLASKIFSGPEDITRVDQYCGPPHVGCKAMNLRRLMPPTDLRPSWLAGFQKGERLIFGPMLHAFDRPFFLLIARGVNRRCNRLQIDQICGRMMPEVRR